MRQVRILPLGLRGLPWRMFDAFQEGVQRTHYSMSGRWGLEAGWRLVPKVYGVHAGCMAPSAAA